MNHFLTYLMFLTSILSLSTGAQEHSGHHHGEANQHMNRQDFSTLVASFESSDRASWQKPDAIIAKLGDLKNKTVIDIGSGTGYFSFRFHKAGAKVICADVDERFLKHIENRKKDMGISNQQMELRKVPYDSSNLRPEEVDLAIIIDTYHHIENRSNYFSEVREGLKQGGQLVVIDFKKEDAPVGPPVAMKMTADTIISELRQAGFNYFDIDRETLPYQYIIQATE